MASSVIPLASSTTTQETTASLARSPLWQTLPEFLSHEERVKLTYERSKSVVQHYRLTADDVLYMSDRYWEFHSDPILMMDGAVATLLTIHYNLCLGTVAKYLKDRPDLHSVVEKLQSFEWNGQYCLTELGHGLDVINMETKATLLPDGSFDLYTPNDNAAKFMPPTSPSGYPCISIVHARLFSNGEDLGPKVFLARLHDGQNMCPGIISKVLAPRGQARPVNHCLTYFDHVRLPSTALLGSLSRPKDIRVAFFDNIYRAITGALSMGVLGVSSMRIASYVAAKYSLRRHVIDASSKVPRPIISFSTQYTTVISVIAQTLVFRAFSDYCHKLFVDANDLTTKHFIAAVMKTTTLKAAHSNLIYLSDRCGAQGLAEVNQISVVHADMRGAAIAEGDILVISIRFAMDLLLQRFETLPYRFPESILAKHEQSLLVSLRGRLTRATSHRSDAIDSTILPLCQPLMVAIGARMAYEAAAVGSLDDDILKLFTASNFKDDPAWYALHEGLDTIEQARMENEAAKKLLPRIDVLLEKLEVEPFVVAPIVSEDRWASYTAQLKEFRTSNLAISKL